MCSKSCIKHQVTRISSEKNVNVLNIYPGWSFLVKIQYPSASGQPTTKYMACKQNQKYFYYYTSNRILAFVCDSQCTIIKTSLHLYSYVICVETYTSFFVFFRTAVVCPIIDVISDETFEYMAGSDMTYGGFNWKLNFRWYPVPQREMDRRKGDRTLPVRYTKNVSSSSEAKSI